MKPVYFQGVNYDPILLAALAPQGVRSHVPTAEVSDLIACREMGERVAVHTGNTYHLLTGAIDKCAAINQMVVLAPSVLKQAALRPKSYTERRLMGLGVRDQDRFLGARSAPYTTRPPKKV